MVRAPLWPFFFLWSPWYWYYPSPYVLNGRFPEQKAARWGGRASWFGILIFFIILFGGWFYDPYWWWGMIIVFLWFFSLNLCGFMSISYFDKEVEQKKDEPMEMKTSEEMKKPPLRSLRMQL